MTARSAKRPWIILSHAALLAVAGVFLAACGDTPEDLAFERCKGEIAAALGADGKLEIMRPARLELKDDAVYGWHLDLDVKANSATDAPGSTGYRCLFVVENRKTPLFLAVLER